MILQFQQTHNMKTMTYDLMLCTSHFITMAPSPIPLHSLGIARTLSFNPENPCYKPCTKGTNSLFFFYCYFDQKDKTQQGRDDTTVKSPIVPSCPGWWVGCGYNCLVLYINIDKVFLTLGSFDTSTENSMMTGKT